jgi:hypothetical protein
MDNNPELYVLLRVGSWERRQKLKGGIAGALWIRHLADVLRRGFESVHAEKWAEEDEARQRWHAGGRSFCFGSERPLDQVLQSRPYFTEHFGLFTSSSVRWYVERETEYHAIAKILLQPAMCGVELINLRGNIKAGGIMPP